jgi:hypothetical protein
VTGKPKHVGDKCRGYNNIKMYLKEVANKKIKNKMVQGKTVKGKVRLRTSHEAQEEKGVEVEGVGGGVNHPLSSAPLPPGKRSGIHCIGSWMGPRADLDGCRKSLSRRDSILGPSSPYRVAIPTELSRPTDNKLLVSVQVENCLAG